ncbi:hypothetical protein V2J09_017552, partial [Rumex salicifolius]
WPNDLYLNGLKVGCILYTSTYTSKKFNVSAGIGLIVDNRQPTTCLNACLQELTNSTCHLEREVMSRPTLFSPLLLPPPLYSLDSPAGLQIRRRPHTPALPDCCSSSHPAALLLPSTAPCCPSIRASLHTPFRRRPLHPFAPPHRCAALSPPPGYPISGDSSGATPLHHLEPPPASTSCATYWTHLRHRLRADLNSPDARMPVAGPLRLLIPSLYKFNCFNRALSSLSSPLTPLSRSLSMDSQPQPSSLLLLCGKSPSDNELATSLKRAEAFDLSDHVDYRVLLYSELQNPSEEEVPFDVQLYMNSLLTACFGRFLIWSPRLTSTHDVVSKKFCELPIGSVCVADFQIKGRGRSSNVWESPKGSLLFSYTIQMEDGKIVPLLQYVVSLAVTEAIKDACVRKYPIDDDHLENLHFASYTTFKAAGLPQLNVRVKWPNDLYLDGLKVGGILCTSTYTSKKFNVSVGIGLNVDNRQPTTCLNACLQELTKSTCHLQREEVMASFFNKFENFFDIFLNQGFQALEELYYKTWLHSGQRVIVKDTVEGQSMNSVVAIQGLTPSGYLLAVSDDGQTCELHPDGNSV